MSENLAVHDDSVSAGYIFEKSGYVINRLVDLLQLLKDLEISSEEKEKQIHSYIEAALWDALKIIATTTGSHWDPEDCEIVATCGDAKEGWNAIKYKYSQSAKRPWYTNVPGDKKEVFYQTLLREHTVLKAEIAVRKELCAKLKPLLEKPRGEARTEINMVMDLYSLQDRCFLRMNHLLDRVNMGELMWPDFCLRFAANLSYLESCINGADAEKYIIDILLSKEKQRKAREKGWFVEEFEPSQVPLWEHRYLQEHSSDSE